MMKRIRARADLSRSRRRKTRRARADDKAHRDVGQRAKGLGVRVSPKGAMTYGRQSTTGARTVASQRLVSLGRVGQLNIKQVRIEAQSVLARALTKSQPEPRPSVDFKDAVTIAKLCDMWLEKAAHRRRGRGPLAGTLRKAEHVENDKGRIEAHIKPLIGKVRVRELNRSIIESYRDAVSRGDTRLTKKGQRKRGVTRVRGGEGTANRSLSLLSTIMSFAVRERSSIATRCSASSAHLATCASASSVPRSSPPWRSDHQGRSPGRPRLRHRHHQALGDIGRTQERDHRPHLGLGRSAHRVLAPASLQDRSPAHSHHRRDAGDH